MFDITNYTALDFFIMESDFKRQNIVGFIQKHNCQSLSDALSYYGYNQSDFTDPDWQELCELYA